MLAAGEWFHIHPEKSLGFLDVSAYYDFSLGEDGAEITTIIDEPLYYGTKISSVTSAYGFNASYNFNLGNTGLYTGVGVGLNHLEFFSGGTSDAPDSNIREVTGNLSLGYNHFFSRSKTTSFVLGAKVTPINIGTAHTTGGYDNEGTLNTFAGWQSPNSLVNMPCFSLNVGLEQIYLGYMACYNFSSFKAAGSYYRQDEMQYYQSRTGNLMIGGRL